jgi:hypothetical protein
MTQQHKLLSELTIPDEVVSVWGRVIRSKPPCPTRGRGTDYYMTIFITDGTIVEVPVNLFYPPDTKFPQVSELPTTEEIIELRRFKVKFHEGSVQLLSAYYSSWTAYSKDPSTNRWNKMGHPKFLLDKFEVEKLESIAKGTFSITHLPPQTPSSPSKRTGRPTLMVKDARSNIFFDLNCQVLRVLPIGCEGQYQALITDFTNNSMVNFDSDSYEGVLQIGGKNAIVHLTIWDNFIPIAFEKIREGCYYHFRNLRARESDLGLVFIMHGDSRCGNPNANIELLDEEQADIIKARARLFEQTTEQMNYVEEQLLPSMSLTKISDPLPHVSFSKIKEIKEHDAIAQIYKLKGIVKQIISSSQFDEIAKLLVDDGDTIELILYGPHYIQFFQEQFASEASIERLSRSLLPSEFCIFSYTKGQRRLYQIFNTQLQ